MNASAVLATCGAMLAMLALGGTVRPAARRPTRPTPGPSSEPPVGPPHRVAGLLRTPVALGVAVVLTAAVLFGPFVVAMTVGAAVGARSVRRVAAERRRRRDIEAQLPDAIDLLVLTIHAGATPAQAVIDVAAHLGDAVRPAFDAVALRLQRGQRLADAVEALPAALGHRAHGIADGIASAERYGSPLAPVLRSLSDEARADRRRSAEAHARSLSVKLSFPLVACTLPSFVLLAIVPAVMGALRSLPVTAGP